MKANLGQTSTLVLSAIGYHGYSLTESTVCSLKTNGQPVEVQEFFLQMSLVSQYSLAIVEFVLGRYGIRACIPR